MNSLARPTRARRSVCWTLAPGRSSTRKTARSFAASARAMARLPEEYRVTLALRFARDLPLAEIAAVLEVPVGTVKSRLSVGARKLREALAEIDGEEGA